MRSLSAVFILSVAVLLTPACTSEAGPEDSGETVAQLCCDGGCGAPEGFCCNPDTFCDGACPSDSMPWDKEKGEPAAPAGS